MRGMRIWRKMLPNAAKMLVNFFLTKEVEESLNELIEALIIDFNLNT
jgi:hypothetical protein